MEIKHLVSKYVYRIEPKPEGGFIARASDPNVPTLEASTREELQQKIQSTVLSGLGVDFPALKLPANSTELKFSFHIEKQPDGSFDIHSSDAASGPVNAASHDEVESHFAEKVLAFIGKHMLEGAPETLRAQLASGDVKVFVKTSGITLTKHGDFLPRLDAAAALLGGLQSSPQGAVSTSLSGPIASNSSASFSSSAAPIDSSPITPVSEGLGKFVRILLALAVLAAVIFFFLHRR